jgi:hypothetical protein
LRDGHLAQRATTDDVSSGLEPVLDTRTLTRHGRAINVIGGILLVGVTVFDLSQNWTMLVAFYT